MSFSHPKIATDERGEAYFLRSVEGQIPSGAMGHLLSRCGKVRVPMFDPLLSVGWILAVHQPVERLAAHGADQPQLRGEPTVPLALQLMTFGVYCPWALL